MEFRKKARKGSGLSTIADVAQLAGVSAITVSRYLNTSSMVSAATAEKIQKAIEVSGYVPNLLAGSLASVKNKLIAAVVPTISNAIFLETIQSLDHELSQFGYQLMLGQSDYLSSREDELISAIIGRRPAGIFLIGASHTAVARKQLKASGIPVVQAWDLTHNPIDCAIGFSHEKAGLEVAQYFKSKGMTHVAILTAVDDRAKSRCNGFLSVYQDAQVLEVSPPTSVEAGRLLMRRLNASAQKVDAIFCSSDLLALGVLIEARLLGIAIPQDLAVMGFADLNFSKDLEPALTTVRIDGSKIGKLAAEYLMHETISGNRNNTVIDVGFSIIKRVTS